MEMAEWEARTTGEHLLDVQARVILEELLKKFTRGRVSQFTGQPISGGNCLVPGIHVFIYLFCKHDICK